MIKKWSNISPFQDIINKYLVSDKGDFTMGFHITTPEAYTLTAEEKRSFYDHFLKLTRVLFDECVFTKQDFIYIDKYKKREKTEHMTYSIYQDELHFDEKPTAKSIGYVFITFPSKKAISTNIYNKIEAIYKRPFKDNLESKLHELHAEASNISNIFISSLRGKFEITRLDNYQLGEYLARFYNLDPKYKFDGKKFPRIDNLELSEGYTKLGNKFISIRSILNEGDDITDFRVNKAIDQEILTQDIVLDNEIQLPTSTMFPVGCGLAFNHILTTSITIKNKTQLIKDLKIEKRWIMGLRNAVPLIGDKVNAILSLEKDLNENNWKPVTVSSNVIFWDETKENINIKDGFVRAAYDDISNDIQTINETFNAANVFLKSCGGNNRGMPNQFISSNERAVRYLNIEQHSTNDKYGDTYLDRFDNLTIVNTRNKKYSNSFNGICAGGTGSGKTFFLHTDLDGLRSRGEDFVFITVKNDLDKYCELYNLPYINTEKKSNNGIDLFFLSVDSSGHYIYDETHLEYITSQLLFTWKDQNDFTTEEKSIIKESIKGFFEFCNDNKTYPTFEDYYDNFLTLFIKKSNKNPLHKNSKGYPFVDFSSYKLVLEEYKNIYKNDEIIDILNTKGIVINLGGIMSDEKKFKIFLNDCFYNGTRKIIKNENVLFTSIIIDECFDAFKGKGAENIASGFKKYRSRGARIFICTQGITELKGLPETTRKQIFDNCYFSVFFNAQDSNEKREWLDYTKEDIRQLESIHTIEETFIKIGRGKKGKGKVFRNRVSPMTYAIYTTDPDDVKIINHLRSKNNNSLKIALQEFADIFEKKETELYIIEHKLSENK
ncbi:MAG: hypothetical protein JKY54_01650 [Flavobacteriales bacterium]|nr:hypothetical protein [Flavobacteriales bacterium]